MKIAVLAGGSSCEREISLISGRAIFDALKNRGLNATLLDPGENFADHLKEWGTTIAFVALHGSFGEDGSVQRILEEAGIAYTGSRAEASARAFNKSVAQEIFKKENLNVPSFRVLKKSDPLPVLLASDYPLVVKPAACGSSIGISILTSGGLEEACRKARDYSDTVLIERYVRGRELTIGILGDQALPPVEVIPLRSFYDTQAKYQDTGTRYECPARLTAAQEMDLREAAFKATRALGCEIMARVDFILGEDGAAYILEVNTIPGFTDKSLLPKAAKAAGIDFPDLCVRILQLSLERSQVAEHG